MQFNLLWAAQEEATLVCPSVHSISVAGDPIPAPGGEAPPAELRMHPAALPTHSHIWWWKFHENFLLWYCVKPLHVSFTSYNTCKNSCYTVKTTAKCTQKMSGVTWMNVLTIYWPAHDNPALRGSGGAISCLCLLLLLPVQILYLRIIGGSMSQLLTQEVTP